MLDNIDKSILMELSKNSRITMKELGKKIHMTGQATAVRVTKLEERGVIKAYTIKVNNQKIGCLIHAIINIYHTNSHQHQPYISFIETQDKYVIHHYKISGDGCYLLECKFPSNAELDEFITKLNEYVNYKITLIINEVNPNR